MGTVLKRIIRLSLVLGFFGMTLGKTLAQTSGGVGAGLGLLQMPTSLNPFEPPSAVVPKTFSSVSTQYPAIALTFDDGPHPEHTPRLLDILKHYGVRATFFVVGRNVEKYPHIAQRIVDEGHQIGNHTMNHPDLVKLKRKKFDDEIKEVNVIIEAYTGKKPTCIRPPYGSLDSKVEALLHNVYGQHVVLWSVDPEDWKKPGSREVARRLIEGASSGGILLAHDIHGQTIDAIPEVIAELKARGYRFGTVDQLLSLPPSVGLSRQANDSQFSDAAAPSQRVSGYRVPVLKALPVGN